MEALAAHITKTRGKNTTITWTRKLVYGHGPGGFAKVGGRQWWGAGRDRCSAVAGKPGGR